MQAENRVIIVFESPDDVVNLQPLTLTRPVFLLKVGPRTILEEIEAAVGAPRALYTRAYLAEHVQSLTGIPVNPKGLYKNVLVVNASYLPQQGVACGNDEAYFHRGKLVYACLRELSVGDPLSLAETVEKVAAGLGRQELSNALTVGRLWDLPKLPHVTIPREAARLTWASAPPHGVNVIGELSRLLLHPESRVIPPVTVDTTKGPVIVEARAVVGPFTYIEGPAYIGSETRVRASTVIRAGSSIGEACRVGGEVSESIMHGYSNKAHDGFLGNSYVGEWVNIAAGAITGNLRNDYGEIVVYTPRGPTKTGETKVGSFIGDHARVSIGTMLNAGTIVGVAANVVAPEMAPKYIPSFTRFHRMKLEEIPLKEALSAIDRMMGRRGRKLTSGEVAILRHVYEATAEERSYYAKFYSDRYGRR
ncbi:putative sugar nucleotidyl transferase [Infirmifilum sp. NZ]|uniref:putative sugar nucleotidyl transferase n=1 Tax=Infirmifilum sp. NZ TaxID=2926850 RepID=UPI0027A18F85|nr:putative sugar nucleotidyl transferase [Infirmifilum sp. NZ]UNQ73092.1 hypothetical protein MOV14_08260 [Infirmifilum sp. NZ]